MKVPCNTSERYVLAKDLSHSQWKFAPEISSGQNVSKETLEQRKKRLHTNIRLYRQYLIARDGFVGFTSLMISSLCLFSAYNGGVSFADSGGLVALAVLSATPLLYRNIRRRTCVYLWQIFTG